MRVLVVNAGSSTLKLRLLGPNDEIEADETIEPWTRGDTEAVARFIPGVGEVDAVGHRVVHGGPDLPPAVLIDGAMEEHLAELTPLAPLHQPGSLAAMGLVRRLLPDVPHVACFDTGFHITLPAATATYALPVDWRKRWPLRRFGFHGLSHGYAVRRVAQLVGDERRRIVSCHLGAGASLCAALDGESVDTTMGFTPLEGLVMATRSGSIDPGLVLWLLTEAGLDAAEVSRRLEEESGLAGLSGGSGDMRLVVDRMESGDEAARLAFDVYIHRLAREAAAMTAALGGLDVLVFTGGVGQHQPKVRTALAARLAHLGVLIDEKLNLTAGGGDTDITASGATVDTLVIEAREDLEIARLTRTVLSSS